MWDLSSLIWVRSLPPSPEVSGKRTFPVKYYTMILQCPRIIVVDYFGFEPRSCPSDVWCASPLSQFPEYKNQEIPVFINNSFMSFFFQIHRPSGGQFEDGAGPGLRLSQKGPGLWPTQAASLTATGSGEEF